MKAVINFMIVFPLTCLLT